MSVVDLIASRRTMCAGPRKFSSISSITGLPVIGSRIDFDRSSPNASDKPLSRLEENNEAAGGIDAATKGSGGSKSPAEIARIGAALSVAPRASFSFKWGAVGSADQDLASRIPIALR